MLYLNLDDLIWLGHVGVIDPYVKKIAEDLEIFRLASFESKTVEDLFLACMKESLEKHGYELNVSWSYFRDEVREALGHPRISTKKEDILNFKNERN